MLHTQTQEWSYGDMMWIQVGLTNFGVQARLLFILILIK